MAGVAADPSAAINNAQLQGGWYNPNISDYQNALNVSGAQAKNFQPLVNYGENAANNDPTSAALVMQDQSGNEGGGVSTASLNQAGMPTISTAGTPSAYTLSSGYDTSSLNTDSMPDKFYIGNYGDNNSSQAQEDATATLQRIKKYDPNATMSLVGDPLNYGSSGSDGGDNDPGSYYQLKYDASKLPKQTSPASERTLVTSGQSLHDTNNNAMSIDPNYGVFTSPENVYQAPTLMDRLGSYLPMAAAMFGAPAILGTVMGGMGTLQGLSNGQGINPLSLAGTALGAVGGVGNIIPGASDVTQGLSSVMPYVNVARTIYGITQGNPGSMLNAGRLVYNGIKGG